MKIRPEDRSVIFCGKYSMCQYKKKSKLVLIIKK